MSRAQLILSVVATISTAGCDATSQPAPIPRDQVAAAMAAAVCTPRCTSVLPDYDPEVCRATLQPQVEAGLAQELAEGGTYNAAAAGRCVADFRASANGVPDVMKTLPFDGDCNDVISGTTKNGGSCTEDATCLPGSYCAHDDDSHPSGICTTKGYSHRGKLGDPCCGDESQGRYGREASWNNCTGSASAFCHGIDGLECSGGICVARPKIGEPCTQRTCVEGAECAYPPLAPDQGTCQPLGKTGDACGDLGAVGCAFDLTCINGHCAAPVPLGGTCASDQDCASSACLDGRCVEAVCEMLKMLSQ